MVKIKQKLEPPQQASPYVINLPQPPVRNAEEYLKAYIGYIYTAVGAIAQEVASIDLHLYKLTYVKNKPKTTEIFEHEALSILHYVNQLATFYEIVEATQIYMELTGEAFWVMLKDNTGPKEFWLLRPDWVKVIPSKTDVIDHYNYYAGGVITEKVEIPKENIIPFKYFHPMNPYRGKGPVQAAALPFDILNFAQEYNRNFFFNSAIPSMVFTSEQKISKETTTRFLNQWQASFGGRTKSNKIAFMGNGMKLDKASFAAKELDFTEQMKNMRDDVLAVFKVPKTVLGLTDDVNRANADSTTRAFMERVITPRMRRFVDTLNEFFLPMFTGTDATLFLDFTDPAPEDVELKLKKYDNARKNTWMTPNEIRAEENMEPLPGGDDLFAPLGSPTGSEGSQLNPDNGTPDENNPDSTNPDTEPSDQNPDEPVKPAGEDPEEPKGLRGSMIRLLRGKEKGAILAKPKVYMPPAYLLKEKPIKHMVKIPQKRVSTLRKEKLTGLFIEPLKQFIGELVATDDYSPLLSKKEQTDKSREVDELKKEAKKTYENHLSGWTDEQKGAYWRQFIQHITEREKHIKEKCQDIFREQEKIVLENLRREEKSFKHIFETKSKVGNVVPTLEDLNKMWIALTNILREIYIEQGNYTMDFLGTGGTINITTEFASQYLLEYGGQLISQIDDTTRSQLTQELSEGFDKGESIADLSKRVKDVFAEADTNRAEMIARSEAIKASNAATVEAYRQSGVVEAKEWLAEQDDRTCPLCESEDGKVVSLDDNYFDKGDSVTVDGQEFLFDYTDIGEPPAHSNCRCTTIPVLVNSQE